MNIAMRVGVALAFVSLVVGAPGCATDAPGPPATRDDTSTVAGMPEQVPDSALEIATDEVAQSLIVQLPNQYFVRTSKTQLVLKLPAALGGGAPVPDERFRAALDSLRAKLMSNETFSDDFVVLAAPPGTTPAGASRAGVADDGAFRDPLQRTPDLTSTARYDPAVVYELSGKFYQVTDRAAGRREYKLFFTVDHPQSGREMIRKEVDVRLVWDGASRQWRRAA